MNNRACVSVVSVSRRVFRFRALLMLIAIFGLVVGSIFATIRTGHAIAGMGAAKPRQ